MWIAACGATDSSTIDITHDVCAGVTVTAPTVSDAQLAHIDAAMALWRPRGVSRLALGFAGSDPLGSIEIRFEPASLASRGLYDDKASVVYINANLADASEVAIVIAHELGHAFGLPHVTHRVSLMNPGNLTTAPTSDDQHAVEALWGRCD